MMENIEYGFIYRIDRFETKKHRTSHTSMYYLNPEDTIWVYGSMDIFKVEYIRVLKNSNEYQSAYENSVVVKLKEKVKQYYNLSYEELRNKSEEELTKMIKDFEENSNKNTPNLTGLLGQQEITLCLAVGIKNYAAGIDASNLQERYNEDMRNNIEYLITVLESQGVSKQTINMKVNAIKSFDAEIGLGVPSVKQATVDPTNHLYNSKL